MPDAIEIDSKAFEATLARVISESKRFPHEVVFEQARGVIRNVLAVTPPAAVWKSAEGDWQLQLGARARMAGQRKVESNISRIYGTTAQAVNLIKAHATHPGMAEGFVSHIKKGEYERANNILRYVNGGDPGIYKFDDGRMHKRLGRGARKQSQPYFYTYEDDKLKAYIQKKKDMVGFLASGWKNACQQLGVALPQWIARHNAPGRMSIEITDTGMTVIMTNSTGYAGEVEGWQRRIEYAMREQVKKMNNRTANWMISTLNRNGLL